MEPESIGIITTYKCTAMCADCCFSCSPKLSNMLDLSSIKKIIDDVRAFSDLKMVIWTGGEAFLLKETLIKGIKYASENGFESRVVSNGFWAVTISEAKKKLLSLKEVGLIELNISTGDNHQKFVDFDNVMNAIYAASELKIQSAIMVESHKYAEFGLERIQKHPLFKKIQQKHSDFLPQIVNSPWVSLKNDKKYDYDKISKVDIEYGCDHIFNHVTVDADYDVLSCCGITVKQIPEMRIGDFREKSIKSCYEAQASDLLKKWIFTAGPINILKQVIEWDNSIFIPKFAHYCQSCLFLHNNDKVKNIICNNINSLEKEINSNFSDKLEFQKLFKGRCENEN